MNKEETIFEVTSTRLQRSVFFRYYWDLALLVCLGLMMPVLLLLPVPLLRVPPGLVGIFFAPGSALLLALYPRQTDLDGVARAALSIGLSVAILPALALLLSWLPWGLRPGPMAISLMIWILLCSSIAAFRRNSLAQSDKGGEMLPGIDLPELWRGWRERALGGPVRRVAVAVLAGIFLLVFIVSLVPDPSRHMTEFYILGAAGMAEDYPRQAFPGQEIQLHFGVANHEGAETRYRIEIYSQGQKLEQLGPFVVGNGQTWNGVGHFSLKSIGDNQQVRLLLFRGKETDPYRRLKLWINVRNEP